MPKKLVKEKKVAKSTTKKEVSNVKKIKMLVTVVDRSKTLFYLDLLEQFELMFKWFYMVKGQLLLKCLIY